ncbi:hypothetical protein [Xanthobacter aminoxidans]|uniref:hypothetical protein n=1 Tax=Xanthobacter aminoxidans TaxID=186280 RepID=UPI002022D722|nr:hypothetical protein [Xanthobacter aminoxidans]MCL8381111.1 hypothetical protein [Xanthobacter aminoxidans]
MLVVVQIPIVDLRGFTAESNRLPVPGWPAPEPDKDFLRAFGAIRRRPSGGLNGWLGEAAVCEAGRGLRFAGSLQRSLVTKSGDWKLRVAYRRFFSDGVATGKFEIGFDVRPVRSTGNLLRVDEVVAGLLKLPLSSEGTIARSLGAAGGPLAQAYARATTSHVANPDAASRFVLAGRPAVVIEHNGRTLCVPNVARVMEAEGPDAPTAIFWHQRLFAADVPVWFLPRPRGARLGPTREIRLYLCRFHAETEAIAKTFRAVSMGAIAPSPRSPQSDRLQRFLLNAFRHHRQVGKRLDSKTGLPFYEAALWHRDHALPGYYDSLLTAISAVNPRSSVQTAIEDYISERRSQDDRATVFVLGDYVMTQNHITNSGTIGVIGEVSHSSVTASQTTLGGASNEAIVQLEALAKILKEQASNPDEEVAAEAVKKAAEKLSSGDESAALAWLKRSGAWALKVAESISAKLAAELIIRASTT